jgi:hypothetical protein
MKMHLLLMIGAAVVLIVLTIAGFVGAPLATLLLIGIVLLCPLMLLGMMGGSHDHSGQGSHDEHGGEHVIAGSEPHPQGPR